MANQLKMANINAILTLHQRGWTQRRIAEAVGADRETVARYVRLAAQLPKPATQAPIGSDKAFLASEPSGADTKPATEAPVGSASQPTLQAPLGSDSKPATQAPIGSNKAFLASGPSGADAKPATEAPVGSASQPALQAPLGSDYLMESPGLEPPLAALESMVADPAVSLPGVSEPATNPSQVSRCEAFRAVILAKLEEGLCGQRVYQDLCQEHGFVGSYYSVRRFIRRLGAGTPLPMRRLECAPGQEVQVDFGQGAPVIDADGKRRRPNVFRIVLSHSRKGYSEVVLRQTTESFLRCLENAFWHFGGVPETVVLDNLRAAVSQADWFDPELNPKVQSFCAHYGTVMLPTKPRMPRHKGKIERGIDYVQENALKGRTFASLAEQNRHLQTWENSVADTRVHGTTRRQVGKVFAEVERAALKPLPKERFPCFEEGQRSVHRDGHVEVDKAYYSVPPEYLGRRVWVRWDSRVVRVFNQRMQAIAMHVKHEPGRFSTHAEHIAAEKISGIERGATWLMTKASQIGPHTAQWAEAVLKIRGIEGVRALTGLVNLAGRHSAAELEEVCALANAHGAYRLRTLRQLLKRQVPRQRQEMLLETHPLIRRLDEYADVVRRSLRGSSPEQGKPESSADGAHTGSSSLLPSRPMAPCPSAGSSRGEETPASSADGAHTGSSSLLPSQPMAPRATAGIDYRQLRSLVSIREVLDLLGFQARVCRGGQVRGACPLHGSTSPRSRVFSVHLTKNMFRCFKCQAAGNHLDLWVAATQQPLYQAALDLCNRLNRPVPWLPSKQTSLVVGS